jgi:hypothetical protein
MRWVTFKGFVFHAAAATSEESGPLTRHSLPGPEISCPAMTARLSRSASKKASRAVSPANQVREHHWADRLAVLARR